MIFKKKKINMQSFCYISRWIKKMVFEFWDCNEKEFDFCDFLNVQQRGVMGMKIG